MVKQRENSHEISALLGGNEATDPIHQGSIEKI